MFMVMREVGIGLRPYTLLHITMMYYISSTQVSLKKLLQEVCEEKLFKTVIKDESYIHTSKSSLLLLSKNATTPSSKHGTTTSKLRNVYIIGFIQLIVYALIGKNIMVLPPPQIFDENIFFLHNEFRFGVRQSSQKLIVS